MLKKIFKYDSLSLQKSLLPIYLITLLLGVTTFTTRLFAESLPLNDITLSFSSWLDVIAALSGVGLFLSAGIACVIIVMRFYHSLFTDEGYLTMTLPVDTRVLLISKILAVYAWIVVTAAVAFVAAFLAIELPDLLMHHYSYFGVYTVDPLNELISILQSISTAVTTVMMVLTGVILGSTFFKKKKIFGAALFFFAIESVYTFINAPVNLLGIVCAVKYNTGIPIMLLSILVALGTSVGLYFLSAFILERQYNIE